MVEAKRSGNKSNFSVAMQIENLLMETAKLESQLQLLYMQTGNIDVWNKIKARAVGIPASFVSAETTSMTYSTTVMERKALIDFSLRNIITPLEQRLSAADFVPNGVEVRFDIDDFLRGSALERAQVYEILNRIGAMSVEQIQEEEDLIDNKETR